MPKGTQAAQIVHAAGESSPGNLPYNTHAVVLATPDEASLKKLEQKLIAAGVSHRAIREPDAPWNGQLMAIGLEPQARKQVRKYLSGLPLLKDKEKKDMKIESSIASEAARELEKLQAWYYAFDEFDDQTYQAQMNKAHYRFKSTLLCALIAHSRGVSHLDGSLEEQAKFLEENKVMWSDLKYRKEERDRIKERAAKRVPLPAPAKPKKSLLQRLREMF